MEESSAAKIQLLKEFKFEKILKDDTKSKIITLYGEIRNEVALLLLEKTAFDLNTIKLDQLATFLQDTKLVENNDVFHWFLSTNFQDCSTLPSVKSTLIWPASETVRKYQFFLSINRM